VEDLLDVSRLRTGRLELRRQTLDCGPFVEEIVERYRMQLEDRAEYRLHFNVPAVPLEVEVDPSRLEQVIDNLLSNAVKYSPTGGEICVALEPSAGGVRLTVTDHGIGIPIGHSSTIFEPFGRAPNAGSQQIPGLGLGLSICRQLVEAHGGRIWASSPGERQGTTVSLWLPIPRPSPEAPSGESDQALSAVLEK
jgi:signal transduction histidine kinase